jgi:hypothetical protein
VDPDPVPDPDPTFKKKFVQLAKIEIKKQRQFSATNWSSVDNNISYLG